MNSSSDRLSSVVDGDNKAYSESSQWSIRQNRNLIAQLRAENKSLRNKLAKKLAVSQIPCSYHINIIAVRLHVTERFE